MTSGHLLLGILSSFCLVLVYQGTLLTVLPGIFLSTTLTLLVLLETGVSIVQATVFTMLICLYLAESTPPTS